MEIDVQNGDRLRFTSAPGAPGGGVGALVDLGDGRFAFSYPGSSKAAGERTIEIDGQEWAIAGESRSQIRGVRVLIVTREAANG